MKKFKKIVASALISTSALFAVPVLELSPTSSANAVPIALFGNGNWEVLGDSLENEKKLLFGRICSKGQDKVLAMIEECQRTGRHFNS